MKKPIQNIAYGSNTEKSPERAIVTLIKAVEETARGRNHINGYSLYVMANLLRGHHNFDDYVTCYNDTKKQQVNELFERIAENLKKRIS
jgi:RAB protein geranylgeranyltransferase component A